MEHASSGSETRDLLRRLIERCHADDLSAADVALMKSSIQDLRNPESMNALLGAGFECVEFLQAVFQTLGDDLGNWPSSTLVQLTESLLFNGLDKEASTIADELRRREPGESSAIRLWALAAGEPVATMRRFAAALPSAKDPVAVVSDAREFARGNVGPTLMSIIDEAAARHRAIRNDGAL